MKEVLVGIALGTNEGERLQNLQEARRRIMALPSVLPAPHTSSAPVFETEPVDCTPGTRPFLNTVVEVACAASFAPRAFLEDLRGIERALGRPTRYPRHAPRTIDLDILYADGVRCDDSELTLPHPRLHERRFVLAPLNAIRPDLIVPGQAHPVAELLRALPIHPTATLYASHW